LWKKSRAISLISWGFPSSGWEKYCKEPEFAYLRKIYPETVDPLPFHRNRCAGLSRRPRISAVFAQAFFEKACDQTFF
jgi:hypothetical protein